MTNISSNPVSPLSKSAGTISGMDMPTLQPTIETQSNMRGTISASPSQMPVSSTTSGAKADGNTQIRDKYNDDVSKAYQTWLTSTAEIHAQDECITEPLAREAFDTRTGIKEAAQANTSFIGRAVIWARNMLSYGASNATFEGLSKKKDPEEIAYSAFKTGGGDLGLKDNGFTDIYNTWMAVKAVAPNIYPENINAEMIQVFKSQPPGKVDPLAILAVGQSTAPSHDEGRVTQS